MDSMEFDERGSGGNAAVDAHAMDMNSKGCFLRHQHNCCDAAGQSEKSHALLKWTHKRTGGSLFDPNFARKTGCRRGCSTAYHWYQQYRTPWNRSFE